MSDSNVIELSVIVPMYNEEAVLPTFFETVLPLLRQETDEFEIICVNDGSSDRTLELLMAHRDKESSIRIINFARNFGKEVAMSAGLDFASGNAVIPIDADLQDPPELIHRLVEKWKGGYDVVLAARKDRSMDSAFKRLSAKAFYKVIGVMSDTPIPSNVGDFRLMSRPVVEAIKQLPERTRFMKGIFAWVGFKHTTVYYSRPTRAAGETKWRIWNLWNFALEGIVSFSTFPLKVWSYVGIACASMSLVYMLFVVIKTLFFGVDVPGYASLISIVLFFNGIILISLGVLGEYIARIFIEVKQRPLYVIDEKWGFDKRN